LRGGKGRAQTLKTANQQKKQRRKSPSNAKVKKKNASVAGKSEGKFLLRKWSGYRREKGKKSKNPLAKKPSRKLYDRSHRGPHGHCMKRKQNMKKKKKKKIQDE